MGQQQDLTFPSADGVHTVHAQVWLPDAPPVAVVQMVHGISEHIGRYAGLAAFLNEHGVAALGHDHLGHGRTARDSSEFGCFPARDGWKTVNRDVHTLRELGAERFPGLPYFLLGHSMGSFQARTYLIDYPGTVDGCVLMGTGQEPAPVVFFGKMLSNVLKAVKGPAYVSKFITFLSLGVYNQRFAPNRTKSDWISSSEAAVDAYLADPLCRFVPTVGMFSAMMEGIGYIGSAKNCARMDPRTPVLLLSGGDDPVGACGKGVAKVLRLFQNAGCRDVGMKLYPGDRHELFGETDHQTVFGDLLEWMEARVAAEV